MDKLNLDDIDLKHLVSENVIKTAQISIEELQKKISLDELQKKIKPEIKSITTVASEVVNSEPVLNVRAEINPSSSIL